MVISESLVFGVSALQSRLEAEILLAFAISQPREFLTSHPEYDLTAREHDYYQSLIQKRERGIPTAYLTHHKEFYGLDFYVDERVMIPRPETELLVDLAIQYYRKLKIQNGTLLDIGTGSGNIAVTLAVHLPNAKIIAVDVSHDALEVAKQNAQTHHAAESITFIQSDLLENIHFDGEGIVANLPYIGTEKFNFVEDSVKRYEPNVALFGGNDGLRIYERFFQQVKILKNLKFLCLEFGFLQREMLESILNNFFVQNNFSFHQDLSGIDRACTILI